MAKTDALDVVKDVVQLSVHAREFVVDVNIGANIPLQSLSRDLAGHVAKHIDEAGGNSDWLRKPDSKIIVQPSVGRSWDQRKTLRELKAANGRPVQLTTERANARFPELIESQADATAAIRNEKFLPWDGNTSKQLMVWLTPAVMALTLMAALSMALRDGGNWVERGAVAGALGLLGLVVTTASLALGRADNDHPVAGSLAALSYMVVPSAVALAVPGGNPVSNWGIIAAGAALWALAWVQLAIESEPRWVHAAALVPGISITVGAVITTIYALWRPAPSIATAGVIALAAVILGYKQPLMARSLAKIVDPHLPSHGERLEVESMSDLAALTRETMTPEARESIIHQRGRTIAARFIGIGLLVGAGLTLIGCGFVAGMELRAGDEVRLFLTDIPMSWAAALTFAALNACLLLSSTWYRDREQRAVGMIMPTLGWLVFLMAACGLSPVRDFVLLGLMCGLTVLVGLIVTLTSWSKGGQMSHTAAGRLQFLEKMVYAVPLPMVLCLLNLFHHIRHI